MRTKTLIACLTTGVLTLSQSTRGADTSAVVPSHTASFETRHPTRHGHRPAVISQPAVSGVIPRALGAGNPLQMLNPLAPERYGTAAENVSFDPDVPGKGNGINLFSISF